MTDSNNTAYPVASYFTTLNAIAASGANFNIPIYQRLYVWKNDQIKTLLDDLHKAYTNAPDEHYYLGGIIISSNGKCSYDLIDGQQRFTTLWLIGTLLEGRMKEFNFNFSHNPVRARLQFSTRDFVNTFFDSCRESGYPRDRTENKELKPIYEALKNIEFQLNAMKVTREDYHGFGAFLMDRLRIMVTRMPRNVDENKLFEISNNRGVQLQHHEILKARLLRNITDVAERLKFAQLWESCSLMNNYVEKNIKDISAKPWKAFRFDASSENENEVGLPSDILGVLEGSESADDMGLLDILDSGEATQKANEPNKPIVEVDYDSGKVRSIISFPMLLLHVLRIYQFRENGQRPENDIAGVDEKNLLSVFKRHFENPYLTDKQSGNDAVREFILLLWDLRVRFDKHIIKWVDKGRNMEIHAIKKLYLNKDTLVRKELESNDGFALLQSMLYHSQQIITHYWLTPLLHKLLSCDDVAELYSYLRKLDNCMFCSGLNEDLRIRSWNMMKEAPGHPAGSGYLGLEQGSGTAYPSYVFYKTDFVLWYFRDKVFKDLNLKKTHRDDWENYRMTAKNSIEHISPQNSKAYDVDVVWEKQDSEELRKRKIDDFGNLVLLASGINSEYSNKIFSVKSPEFLAKSRERRLDSLKSALIYEHDSWDWSLCSSHRQLVKEYLDNYFKLI